MSRDKPREHMGTQGGSSKFCGGTIYVLEPGKARYDGDVWELAPVLTEGEGTLRRNMNKGGRSRTMR